MDLGALATTGASTIVGLMVTDSWAQVKARLARFFAGDRDDGGGADGAPAAETERELDASQRELVLAREDEDEEAVEDVARQWRSRLRRTLRDDPAAAGQLEALLAELRAEAGTDPGTAGATYNTISDATVSGPVIQAGTVSGVTVRYGGGPTGGTPPG